MFKYIRSYSDLRKFLKNDLYKLIDKEISLTATLSFVVEHPQILDTAHLKEDFNIFPAAYWLKPSVKHRVRDIKWVIDYLKEINSSISEPVYTLFKDFDYLVEEVVNLRDVFTLKLKATDTKLEITNYEIKHNGMCIQNNSIESRLLYMKCDNILKQRRINSKVERRESLHRQLTKINHISKN